MDVRPPESRPEDLCRPALSAADRQRLRFFAHLRRTGRLRPAAPVSAEVEALCTALLREPPAPRPAVGRPYHGGLPTLWQAYAEQQGWHGAQTL